MPGAHPRDFYRIRLPWAVLIPGPHNILAAAPSQKDKVIYNTNLKLNHDTLFVKYALKIKTI